MKKESEKMEESLEFATTFPVLNPSERAEEKSSCGNPQSTTTTTMAGEEKQKPPRKGAADNATKVN